MSSHASGETGAEGQQRDAATTASAPPPARPAPRPGDSDHPFAHIPAAEGPCSEDDEPRAHWGYRVGAFITDASAAAVIGLFVGEGIKAAGADPNRAESLGGLSVIAAWVLVTAGASAITGGQTLGKWIAGTRVVRDNGRRVGFGWSFLRDVVCRLLYFVPLFFVIDSLFPLGAKRQSVRDKMVHTNVVKTPVYRRRRLAIILAAIVGVGAWTAVAAALGGFDDQPGADGSAPYTRGEWIADCGDGGGSAGRCGCLYDRMSAELTTRELDQLETIDPDALSDRQSAALADAQSAC